ncbi:MAG: ABC-2 family transporter protein [Chloroflexaceae bacterium]|jgi:ABC-2 type transport system permease protein|nr:ABC-2 family transporter protein [Chloroflexaceae bacterium]
MLRIYQRLWALHWAESWQYRANTLMYLLYWLVSPVVYLAVWTTVANTQGDVRGLTANDFITYYLMLLIVDNLTSTITVHILAYRIQDGTFSGDLVRPVHPILGGVLMNNLSFKVLNFGALLPIWLVLLVLFRPDFSAVTWLNLVLALPAIVLGFGIAFLLGAIITCIAFWTTRVHAINEFYNAVSLLLGGMFVPLALLPPLAQQIAQFLPFQLYLSFPILLILGKLTPEQIGLNFGLQVLWLGLTWLLFELVWRNGVRRFSAVGA